MGEIFLTGPLSGKQYSYKIAGDSPTADERLDAQARLRQREMLFAEQYKERFGGNVLPSTGLGGQLSEFGRGIRRGAGGLFETAALGMVTPFEEETEQRLREGIRSLGLSWQERYAPAIGREETVGGRLGEAVGSMGAIAGSGLAASLLGGPVMGFGVATTLGAAAGAGEASERARAFGATQEERNLAARWGVAPGALEVVPLIRLSRVLERGGFRERLKRAFLTGGEEGLQEAASSVAQNLIEQNIYNPEQGTFTGTGEDLGYGFGAGALIQAISDLVIPGRLQRRSVEKRPTDPELEATSAPETTPEDTPTPSPDDVAPSATTSDDLAGGVAENPLAANIQDFFEERAAILESDGFSRQEAEAIAARQTVEHMEDIGVSGDPSLRLTTTSLRLKANQQPIDVDMGPPTTPLEAYIDDPTPTSQPSLPFSEGNVRNTTLDPRTRSEVQGTQPTELTAPTRTVEAKQETSDAATQTSGFVQPDDAPNRARVEGGIAQLGVGDGTPDSDPSRTEPSDRGGMGEPDLGASQPDASEGAQPSALRPGPGLWVSKDFDTPVNIADTPPQAGPDGRLYQQVTDPETGAPSFVPLDELRISDAPEGAEPTEATQAAPAEPAPAEATPTDPAPTEPAPTEPAPAQPAQPAQAASDPLRGIVPTTRDEMNRVLDDIGLAKGKRSNVRKLVNEGDVPSPARFIEALRDTKLEKDTKAKRDRWVAEASDKLRSARQDPAVNAVVDQLIEAREAQRLRDEIAQWFNKNAHPDVKLLEQTIDPSFRDTIPLLSSDMRIIKDLLDASLKDSPGDTVTSRVAAKRYFSRASDPGNAFLMIAHDASFARAARLVKDEKKRPAEDQRDVGVREGDLIPNVIKRSYVVEPGRELNDNIERGELALFEGHGHETGEKAQQWIIENLSPDAIAKFISARDGRATKEKPGYQFVSYGRNAGVRDKIKGKRQGAGRTVDELTDKQLEERKAAMKADNEVVEEAARKSRGLSEEAWANFTPEQRHELVRDYQDLRDVSRSGAVSMPSQASLPPQRSQPAPATPTRRYVPTRDRQGSRDAERIIDMIRQELNDPSAPVVGSLAGEMSWFSSAHPVVTALAKSGRVREAVRLLSRLAPNTHLRQLAQKLHARMEGVTSQLVSAETMNRVRAAMSPETPTLGVETPSGVFIHPLGPEAISAMRREGHTEAASIVEEFGGQILFNEDAPMSAELILHEATHAVGDKVLTNKSHPLTRQLDTLRTQLLKSLPADSYGLSNVREFFAEGMTNPVFRRQLSYVTTDGKPYSAFQNFKNIVRNWLRGILGREPIKADTALTRLDDALDAIIGSNPNEAFSGDVLGASFAPGGFERFRDRVFDALRVPTEQDMANTRRVIQNSRIPKAWKGTLMRFAMPLDYMTDAASKYMPSARKMFDLVMQHQADIQKGASLVAQTTEATAKALAKYRRNQNVINDFNELVYMASLHQVDPTKPLSSYQGYSFEYNVLDGEGKIVRKVESQRFKTPEERNRAILNFNLSLFPDDRGNPLARAKKSFDEDADQVAAYQRLKNMHDSLPKDLQVEVKRMFGLQPTVGRELVEAIRSRLEALIPNNRSLQNKVFGHIYDKILSNQMLDPFVSFRRRGEYWLSYSAVDPTTVTIDPVTGQPDYSNARVELVKHSFTSELERTKAITALQALPPEHQVRDINPYQNPGSMHARPTVAMEFVSNVLDAIDGSAQLEQTGVKQEIIELMLDSLPETSFINSFRKREGVRGFIGDMTPITQNYAAGDVVKNLRESAMTLSRKAVDLKYGAKFSALRSDLEKEFQEFQGKNPRNLDPYALSRERDEAKQYYEMLREYSTVPFRKRANWSRTLTGGAYMLTLGLNVSTALITMSQVPLYAAPFLAGKHGMSRTISAIMLSNRILAQSGKERTIERIGDDGQIEQVRIPVRVWDFSLDNPDLSSGERSYLRVLQQIAKLNGVFNRSLMQDELLGEQPTLTQKFAGYSGVMQHHAERYSREVALIASYHLSLQDAMGQQALSLDQFVQGLQDGSLQPTPEQQRAAALEAVNVSEKTNGPIYAAAGPLMSQNDYGSIAYLFKRHPLSMLNLIYQTATRANPLGTNDPADRKIAQRQLGGMLGMLGLMSGVMGLPMMQQIGWLYDLMFAEDDEPDFETVTRITLGEAGTYGLIDYLTGMKVSERLGMGSAIYRPGFRSDNFPLPYQIFEGLGGPVVGLGMKYLDRAPKLLERGEYWRFAESVAPTALGNVLRAVRFESEGIRTMRGDLIADDIGPFHIGAQALGFMPTTYAQRLAVNSLGTRINNAINTRRSTLLQRRNRALRDGDFREVQRIDMEIQEFNQRHPNNRIERSTIRDSIRSFNDRTAQTNFGLYVSPKNRAYIDSIISQIGSPTA